MYAVVSTGGKQLKVEKGTIAVVEKLDAAIGDAVTMDVLFVADGDDIIVGADAAAATVTVEVVEHFKGEKQLIFKFKKRKGYKRTKGHRQNLTKVLVTDIATTGGAKKAAKKAEPEAKAPKAAPKTAKKAEASKAEPKAAPKAEAPKAAPKAAKKAEAPKAAAAEVAEAQCEALKADGERCTNNAKEGSKYCGVHAKKYDA